MFLTSSQSQNVYDSTTEKRDNSNWQDAALNLKYFYPQKIQQLLVFGAASLLV
jgi:hypothetical protein